MNQTKKITQGAMLLALVGAFLLIDRYLLAYYFDELVFLLQALIIIVYACKYSIKDALKLIAGLLVITLLFGGTSSYFYFPLAVMAGLWYSYAVKKKMNRWTMLAILMLVFIIGEFLITIVMASILGTNLNFFLEEINAIFDQTMKTVSPYTIGDTSKHSLILAVLAFSFILIGALEGLLIHLLAIIILKRFHIIDVRANQATLKLPPYLAIINAIPFIFLLFLNNFKDNERLSAIIFFSFFLATSIYYIEGISFLFKYAFYAYRINILPILIIISFLVPIAIVFIIIVGFFHMAGFTNKYLEKSKENRHEKN